MRYVKLLQYVDRFSLQQRFELIGLFVITPFGLAMVMQGRVFWGALTLLVSTTIALSFLLSHLPLLEFTRRVLSVLVPAAVNLAFMTYEPDYAVLWSYPMVVYLYFQIGPGLAGVLNVLFLTVATLLMSAVYSADLLARFMGTHIMIALFSLAFAIDRRRTEQALTDIAHLDELTGLSNRRHVLRQMGEWMERSERYDIQGVLLFIDVDGFKAVNDRYGHAVGDLVLARLASILKHRVRATDILGRLGGEEFLVLLGHTGVSEAIRVAEALQERCAEENFAHQQALKLSIGIAVVRKGEVLEAWIRRADLAMYEAKSAGGARWYLDADPLLPTPSAEQLHSN